MSKRQPTSKLTGRNMRRSNADNRNNKPSSTETKLCPVCNRPFQNRKKWESRGVWPSVIYCSKKCQKACKYPKQT